MVEQFAAFLFWKILWKFKKSFLSKFSYELHTKKMDYNICKLTAIQRYWNSYESVVWAHSWSGNYILRWQRNSVSARIQLQLHLVNLEIWRKGTITAT